MTLHQKVALFYFMALMGAASLNYIPGVTDGEGVAFGVFALRGLSPHALLKGRVGVLPRCLPKSGW